MLDELHNEVCRFSLPRSQWTKILFLLESRLHIRPKYSLLFELGLQSSMVGFCNRYTKVTSSRLEQNIRLRRWDPTPYRLTYSNAKSTNHEQLRSEAVWVPASNENTISICSVIENATMCSIHVSVDFICPESLPTFPTEMRSTATGYMVAAITLFNHTFAFRASFTMLIGPFIE